MMMLKILLKSKALSSGSRSCGFGNDASSHGSGKGGKKKGGKKKGGRRKGHYGIKFTYHLLECLWLTCFEMRVYISIYTFRALPYDMEREEGYGKQESSFPWCQNSAIAC